MPLVYFQFGDTLLVCIETCQGMSLRYDAMLLQWINTGGLKQKHKKKQPFSDASASHLSLVLWHV